MCHCVVAATHFMVSPPPSLGPFLQTISGDSAKRHRLAPGLHTAASPMAGLAATDTPEQLSFELRCRLSTRATAVPGISLALSQVSRLVDEFHIASNCGRRHHHHGDEMVSSTLTGNKEAQC
jgi:hypothetical protein